MKPFTFVLALSFLGGCAVAFAADRSISQKGRVFSETAITLKKGEAITFVNDDNIAHNIFSQGPIQEFNLGTQSPGSSAPVTFSKAGEVTVLCAIHPRMKLVVTVND
jgi:plastocyanin